MLIFSPYQHRRKVNTYPATLQWVNNLEFALQIATCPHIRRLPWGLTGFSVIHCPGFPCHPLPTPACTACCPAGGWGRGLCGEEGPGCCRSESER